MLLKRGERSGSVIMRLSLQTAAAACGVFGALFLSPQLTPAVVSAASAGQGIETCANPIGDVTGDGFEDIAVTVSSAQTGRITAYLVSGRPDAPASMDWAYVRSHLAGILTGPAAQPFACISVSAPGPRLTGAKWRVLRRRLLTTGVLDQPTRYQIVDLNPLAPGGLLTANRINDAGKVVGQLFTSDSREHAFVYDGDTVLDLGTLGGSDSEARAINAKGDIVGLSDTGAFDNFGVVHSAFLWSGELMLKIGPDWSAASAINNSGQIAGEMRFTSGVDLLHAFLYDHGTFTDLGSLPPLGTTAYSAAHAINEAGTVIGESQTFTQGHESPAQRFQATRAFMYTQGEMRDLGSLGPACSDLGLGERCFERSVATDINESGTIVGLSSTVTNARGHAFMSDGTTLTDLGALGGNASYAYGINDSGQIVGGFVNQDDTYFAPFLYDRGTMYDLNDLVVNPLSAGAMPFAAYSINNFGQIVGNHHLLNPLYEQAAPGQPFGFSAVLGETLTFAFWVSRGSPVECDGTESRLLVVVTFDVPGTVPDANRLAAVVQDCEKTTNWQAVSVRVPQRLRGDTAAVRVRLLEIGPRTQPLIYLRQFSMQ
jgi:probable HAF family extracellular repeat protein